MDTESLLGQMEKCTKGIGKMENSKEEVYTEESTVKREKESGLKERN